MHLKAQFLGSLVNYKQLRKVHLLHQLNLQVTLTDDEINQEFKF